MIRDKIRYYLFTVKTFYKYITAYFLSLLGGDSGNIFLIYYLCYDGI